MAQCHAWTPGRFDSARRGNWAFDGVETPCPVSPRRIWLQTRRGGLAPTRLAAMTCGPPTVAACSLGNLSFGPLGAVPRPRAVHWQLTALLYVRVKCFTPEDVPKLAVLAGERIIPILNGLPGTS